MWEIHAGMSNKTTFEVLMVETPTFVALKEAVERGCEVIREVAVNGRRLPMLYRCGNAVYNPATRTLVVGDYEFRYEHSYIEVTRPRGDAVAVDDAGHIGYATSTRIWRDGADAAYIGKLGERVEGEIETISFAKLFELLDKMTEAYSDAGVRLYRLTTSDP
jgi:hypothetical protein